MGVDAGRTERITLQESLKPHIEAEYVRGEKPDVNIEHPDHPIAKIVNTCRGALEGGMQVVDVMIAFEEAFEAVVKDPDTMRRQFLRRDVAMMIREATEEEVEVVPGTLQN